MNDAVSVIIPTYNRAAFLPYAIDSALAQALPPLEVIVADDASTDETPHLMQDRYGSNPTVKYLRFSTNQGQYPMTRQVAPSAQGDLVAFLDSDDVWLPGHLESVLRVFASDPDTVAVLTQRGHIDEKGQVLEEIVPETFSGEIADVLFKRIIFHPSRLVVKRDVWLGLPKIPNPRHVDYFNGVSLVHDYGRRVHVLSERTVWMRVHENQSFSDPRPFTDALGEIVDKIFAAFPDLAPYEKQVRAANFFHAAYFLWLGRHWGEAWQSLWQGIRRYPQGIGLKDFWVALSRLVIPPRVRGWIRRQG